MCQRNWAKYNSSLVQRRSLSFYCSPETIQILRKASKVPKQNGRPPYPMQLILLLILLKTSYSLSYRECQGMANSLFLPMVFLFLATQLFAGAGAICLSIYPSSLGVVLKYVLWTHQALR